jgi:signal transduction histidine kinase
VNKANQMSKKSENLIEIVQLWDNYSLLYASKNQFKQAYQYKNLFSKYKDSLLNKENIKAVEEINTKYQTVQKEKKIIQQQAEAKQKNVYLIGLSVLALLTGLIGFLIYKQQKQKNQQLAQENELKAAIVQIDNQNKLQEQRLSISRDLHDNIGSQLTFIISSVDNIKYGFDIINEKLDTKLTNISNFAKDTIVELRDTIWAMNSNEISFEDLEARINNYIEKAKDAKDDVSFSFAFDETIEPFKKE